MDIATPDQSTLNDQASAESVPEPEPAAPAAEEAEPAEAAGETPAEASAAPSGDGTEEEAPADDEAGDESGQDGTGEASERPRRRGPGQHKSDEELAQEALVLLFASPEPLSQARLVELLLRPEPARVRDALALLGERLEASDLPMVLQELAGGWRLLSDPEYGDVLARLKKEAKPERISSAALETLAIVAYRQPVTKAEIEAIRGVQSGALLRSLVDRGLVRVSGRADLPGSPLQYGTTRDFLDRFGLGSLKDLPRDAELTSD